MLVRLAAARTFARGQKAGLLKRSGGAASPWRSLPGLNLGQRVIVKAHVSRHGGKKAGGALAAHVAYLARTGTAEDGREAGRFYGAEAEGIEARDVTRAWSADRHHFRFIISPEHGDRLDLQDYTRELMGRVAADLKEPSLEWLAVNHYDTDQPHTHVLLRGRRADGRDLVIPGRYIGYGFRGRAQEIAHERLGELTREEAERSVWREISAQRSTALDRKLVQIAVEGRLSFGGELSRTDAYGAVLRGRLAHLEALGMATPVRGGAELAPDLLARLDRLGMERDVIRTLHQRMFRLQRRTDELGREAAAGRVVESGWLDELQCASYVVIEGPDRAEVFARLGASAPPKLGERIRLEPTGERQARLVALGRFEGLDLEANRLLPIDRELMRRSREAAEGRRSPTLDDVGEGLLRKRGEMLLAYGRAELTDAGLSLTRDGYLALRDADIRLAIKEQLGREAAMIVHGLRGDGRRIGSVRTASGLYEVQSRGVGYAVGRPGARTLDRGAELSL
jgi:hypothetical protein